MVIFNHIITRWGLNSTMHDGNNVESMEIKQYIGHIVQYF